MPSVTMKGIIRKPAMISPLISPMPPATPIVSTIAVAGVKPFTSEVAPTTLDRATTEPTLKSMPPLTMIMVIPSAPIATITVCNRMILQLSPVKKCERTVGLSENRPMTSASPNTGPAALSSRQTFGRYDRVGRFMRGSAQRVSAETQTKTRMTNDEIRRNDQIRRTKPAIAQLGAFGHSGFGFHSSFVIQRGRLGLPDGRGHQRVFIPLVGRPDRRQHAATHHADPVAHAQQLGHIGADE